MSFVSFLYAGVGALLAWLTFPILLSAGLTNPVIAGGAIALALWMLAPGRLAGSVDLGQDRRLAVARRRQERLAANGNGIGIV